MKPKTQEYGPSRRIGHSVERSAASASAARAEAKVANLFSFFWWRGAASSQGRRLVLLVAGDIVGYVHQNSESYRIWLCAASPSRPAFFPAPAGRETLNR
jgi:hypothetical protein